MPLIRPPVSQGSSHPAVSRPSYARRISVIGGLMLGTLLPATTLVGCFAPKLSSVKPVAQAPTGYLVRGARVFDGKQLLPVQDVVIQGDQIMAMGAPESLALPPGAELIRASGLTLLPGLTDMHTHLNGAGTAPWKFRLYGSDALAQAFLYAGVTTTLVASNGEAEDKLHDKAVAGKALAPNLFLAGPGLTAPGGHPIPLLTDMAPKLFKSLIPKSFPQVSTPEEARLAVREVKEKFNPPFYKMFFDSLPPEAPHLTLECLKAAAQEAKALGMRPIAHVGSSQDMVQAAEAGVELIMHVAYSDAMTQDQFNRLVELKVPFVPTLRIFSAVADAQRGSFTPLELEMVPQALLQDLKSRPADYSPEQLGKLEPSFPKFAENGRTNAWRLIEAGVPFYVGTDSGVPGVFPGAGLHTEISALATLGLSPAVLLERLTSGAAQFLDPKGNRGMVAPGKKADLILVKGNPLEDLTALDHVEEVFLNGVRLARRKGGE